MSRATLLEETGTNLKMGDRVRLTEPLDYDGTPIGEGEEGTVLGGTPLGGVEIELDETHCGLAEWDNCVTLFDTELNHLECVTLASTVATCLATMGVDPIIAH